MIQPRVVRLVLAAACVVVAGQRAAVRSAPAPGVPAAIGLPAPSCEALTGLALPHATITKAEVAEAEAGRDAAGQGIRAPRPVCRVAATLAPSPDSAIGIEVWMPVSGWNHKFQAVGNGAFSGAVAYGALATAVGRGYAAASTDTGHAGNTARFAQGHPEKVADFAWRAVHEMTVAAKQIVAAYYEAPPRHAYWTGCSAGGRQALKEAQGFPGDFDGIVAGAPGLDWTGRAAQAMRVAKVLESTAAARLLPPQRELLHRAVLNACDALDGVRDGLLEDPERCTFDPGALQCRAGAAAAACLSPAQVETARLLYSSLVNPKNGRQVGGLQRGSELGWTDLGWTASARATGLDQFRYLVHADPAWTADRFDAAADLARADDADGGAINALNPDLGPFFARGGRLIQYHGWSDPQISPANSVQYYRDVTRTLGGAAEVQASYRLFMVPGMGHCGGGEGPSAFDMLAALERWVEQGQAPDRILASQVRDGGASRTRPLCPYPQVARYAGTGDPNAAASFTCSAPRLAPP